MKIVNFTFYFYLEYKNTSKTFCCCPCKKFKKRRRPVEVAFSATTERSTSVIDLAVIEFSSDLNQSGLPNYDDISCETNVNEKENTQISKKSARQLNESVSNPPEYDDLKFRN